MLNRRELLTLIGCIAAGVWPTTAAAAGQARQKDPKPATVTLTISGMT